jgi:small subunit ribosomal protein S11
MTEDKTIKKDDTKVKEENIPEAESLKAPERIETSESRDKAGLVELPESVRLKLEKQKEIRAKKIKKRKGKKKQDKTVMIGKAYVKSSYNNTIITLTDLNGNVISWASAGIAGFKGPKKATPYAAQVITRIAVERAREMYGLNEVSVFVRGVGTGREAAVRALNANGLNINLIKDITPIPHNGCRPKKPRRV